MDRILLTDGLQRKTLAAVRTLGRQGDLVYVADSTRCSTSRFSRYCHRGLLSPRPDQTERYWAWLLAVQRQYDIDVLLPMDDLTTALAVARQDDLPCRALLPTEAQFGVGRDKAATAALAARAGVRAPLTIEALTLAETEAAVTRLGEDVVLKPRFSSGGRGIAFVTRVADVARVWAKARPEWGGFLVQERVPFGRKFDVCLLFGPDGDLRASFAQEELRWFPVEYGASTLQESAAAPDLVALALRLLEPVGWRGPVEIEFMLDPAGEPVLMEINPRFWASLALAIRCGVDFPRLTAALAAGRSVHGPATYPVGVRCRWSLPGDLLLALSSHRLSLRSFCPAPDGRTFDDIVSRDDPWPTFGTALAMIRYSCDPRMWRLLLRW